MADSFVQLLTHITFHIKPDGTAIREEHLPRVFQYIGGEIRSLKGVPFIVGGCPDHIHILCALPKTLSMSDFMMNVKKGSSKWIKQIDPCYAGFSWQDGYGAFSVSYANKDRVINYIAHQKEHHQRKTAKEELREFLVANNVNYDDRYV